MWLAFGDATLTQINLPDRDLACRRSRCGAKLSLRQLNDVTTALL
jgi:hypothetical protein